MAQLRRPPNARRRRVGLGVAAATALLVVLMLNGSHRSPGSSDSAASKSSTSSSASGGGGDKAQQEGGQQQSKGSGKGTGMFYTVEVDGKEEKREMLDEPIPEDCYAHEHLDLDGSGMSWGLTYKLPSAAQCCKACKEKPVEADGKRCTNWVYCPSPTGECWAPDIWNHTTGECWLKWQKDWDGKTDMADTNIKINSQGVFSDEFRKQHTTAPEMVQWMAGLNPKKP